jgi:hypothetical protein
MECRMSIPLHTRALCDECGTNPAIVQIDETFFLCERCDASINGAVENSVAVSDSPFETVNAATGVSSAPNPGTVAAINSNPATSSSLVVAADSARCSKEAAPLFIPSNTPEASGTARKAPSGSLFGEPSRISDRASLFIPVDPELEAAISALEAQWICVGLDLANLASIARNSSTFRVVALSDNVSKSISVTE